MIFIIDPRYNNPYLSFTVGQAINYKLFKNNKTLIIHRINECNKKRYKSNLDIDKILKREKIPFSDYGTTFAREWHQVFFQDPEGNVVEVHQKIS